MAEFSNAKEVGARLRTRAALLAARLPGFAAAQGLAYREMLLAAIRVEAPVGKAPIAPPNSTRDYTHTHLRDSFNASVVLQGSTATIRLVSSAPYVNFVLQGTRPHVILPTTGQFLTFQVGGQWVFARQVNHPGTKENPFVGRAVATILPAMRARFAAEGKTLLVRF